MKKSIIYVTSVVMALTVFFSCMLTAQAAPEAVEGERVVSETVEYLDNGIKVVITTVERTLEVSPDATVTVLGTQTYDGVDIYGNKLWSFTINGVFTVILGRSSSCEEATCSAKIISSDWDCVSSTAYRSGGRAIGTVTFRQKGSSVTGPTFDLAVSCNVYGNITEEPPVFH